MESNIHVVSVLIMFACGRGSVCALYYTVLYVLWKTSMLPKLTLLYHHMINLLSSYDKPHHHMMNIIYLVTQWDFCFLFMPTWRMIGQKNFHIVCAPGTHSILKQNQNIISFNPWINQILLYVVDSTNQQWNLSLWYLWSCFRCAALILKDLQFSCNVPALRNMASTCV